MVKQPLQIRLTEPVIFLRGPSTGLDFRGRPQAVRDDAAPAMLRGLLTLRLSKPTRIRKIEIKLEGKARTEWPEGIGPRRLDTSEEHTIVDERTTFYTYKDQLDPRRSESIGPGLALDHSAYDDEDLETLSPQEEADFQWINAPENDRGRGRAPRSASAFPEGGWSGFQSQSDEHGSGASRNISGRSSVESPLEGFDNLALEMGPTPAYTPENRSETNSRASSIRQGVSARTQQREPILSPIMSAAPSRATSDRGDSTSTERRLERQQRPDREPLPGVNESEEVRPILEVASRRASGSGVRFEDTLRFERSNLAQTPEGEHAPSSTIERPPSVRSRRSRTASILTTDSTMSDGTNSTGHGQGRRSSHGHGDDSDGTTPGYHPTSSAVQAISRGVTPLQTPAPSAPPSIRGSNSVEDLNTDHAQRPAPLVAQPAATSASLANSASSSRSDLREVRAGRTSRTGSATTIIVNHDPTASTGVGTSAASQTTSTNPQISGPSTTSSQRQPTIPRIPSEDAVRREHKFSLSAALRGLSQDVKDRVRNKSRSRTASAAPSRRTSFSEQNGSGSRAGSAIPQRLVDSDRARTDFHPPHGRGGAGRQNSRERSTDRGDSLARGRNKGMKALTGAFHGDEDDGEHIHHWKEFKKGVYNYPISFQIPVDAPPTIHAEFGTVSYRLKATVIRVGALTANLVDEMEVTMIASPQEDDLEETENVIVERQWEEQMRYQITLNGKAFPIGGTIPISIRLMPLIKCKIHRVSVTLEEKTDYFAQERKVARHEQPKKYTLLFIKQPDKKERIEPLLPIISDDPNAARESPLAEMALEAAMNDPTRGMDIDQLEAALNGNNDDRMYAGLMEPLGPWHLEKSLQIPDCNARIRFSTKHDKTNISVGHSLKVILRVERGDDVALDAKGKRKQFDIIIETPIKILDCRVNPQWNSLPTYSAYNSSAFAAQTVCSVHNKTKIPPIQLESGSSRAHLQIGNGGSSSAHAAESSSSAGFSSAPDARIASTDFSTGSGINGGVASGMAAGGGAGGGMRPPVSRGRSGPSQSQSPHPQANSHGHGHGHAEGAEDTLLERNIVYDRLMSGQETETGEVPPTYGEAVAQAIRSASASRSASRPRLGRNGTDDSDGPGGGQRSGRMMRTSSGQGQGQGQGQGSIMGSGQGPARSRTSGLRGDREESRSVSRIRGEGDRERSSSRSVSRIRGNAMEGERETRRGSGMGLGLGGLMGIGSQGRDGGRSQSRGRM